MYSTTIIFEEGTLNPTHIIHLHTMLQVVGSHRRSERVFILPLLLASVPVSRASVETLSMASVYFQGARRSSPGVTITAARQHLDTASTSCRYMMHR